MTYQLNKSQITYQQLGQDELRQMAEEEYFRLQSKFHVTENTKSDYSHKLQASLIQQSKVLNILHNEKENLEKNIAVTRSKRYRGLEDEGLTKVYNFIDEESRMRDEINKEKSYIVDIQREIDNVKKEIITCNKTDVQETKITENIQKSAKRVAMLENKLQVATVRFADILKQNDTYRKEIGTLLNERKNFFKSYMHMYKQLLHGKQIMLDLVEQATTTYDQREEAYTKLKSLQEKTLAETRIQSKDVQELKRRLENAQDLYHFLAIKGQKRILADLEAREAREKRRAKQETIHRINKYIVLLDKVRNLSDEKNIDKFVARFKKSEEENMGLFNYVNEVNNEVENLQCQVTALLERIDEQRELNEKRAKEQQDVIANLTKILEAKQEAFAHEETRLHSSEMMLNDLLFNIEKMFQEFECDTRPVLALLGNNAHVNIYNVTLCLRLLEHQLYEFIYITYAKEKSISPEELITGPYVQEDFHMVASKRPQMYHLTSSSPCPLCVETDRIFILDETNENDKLEEYDDVHRKLLEKVHGTDMTELLHNISTCRLPRSRAIMQARFQEQEHEKIEAQGNQ